jgi:hypothetical protein
MKSAKPVIDGQTPRGSLEDGFERLRQAFEVRLCGDRVRLIALRSALAHLTADPAPILAEIQMFAHKLRGAAAIFEKPEIGRAAKSLELAAMTALAGGSSSTDPSLESTLATLVERLPATAPVAAAATGGARDQGVE